MLDSHEHKTSPFAPNLERDVRRTLNTSCKLIRESRAIMRDLDRMLRESRELVARHAAARARWQR
jgi:hypothetical protein